MCRWADRGTRLSNKWGVYVDQYLEDKMLAKLGHISNYELNTYELAVYKQIAISFYEIEEEKYKKKR